MSGGTTLPPPDCIGVVGVWATDNSELHRANGGLATQRTGPGRGGSGQNSPHYSYAIQRTGPDRNNPHNPYAIQTDGADETGPGQNYPHNSYAIQRTGPE